MLMEYVIDERNVWSITWRLEKETQEKEKALSWTQVIQDCQHAYLIALHQV